MRLKVTEDTGLVQPLALGDGFEVMVRHRTRSQLRDFVRSCSRQMPARGGGMEERLDEELWNQKAPAFYLAGWSGCKPSVLRKLGVPLAEDPPTDADGCIPFDAELAQDVWRYSLPDRFADPIADVSRRMQEMVELGREKKSEPAAA